MTIDECKNAIRVIGNIYSIPPRLISTRLLSKDDKQDMLDDILSPRALMEAVEAWKANDMPMCANH